MNRLFSLFFVFFSFYSYARIDIQQIDPFLKPLPGKTYNSFSLVQAVAINDNVTTQYILKSNVDEKLVFRFSSETIIRQQLNAIKAYQLKNVAIKSLLMASPADVLETSSRQFPDPLIPLIQLHIKRGDPITVLFDMEIFEGIKPGTHKVHVDIFSTKKNRFVGSFYFSFEIFPVAVPKKTMDYVNWYHDVDYKLLNNGKAVVQFSNDYWKIFENVVDDMKKMGQTIFTINPLFLTRFIKIDKSYKADYTNFDKAVNIILEKKMNVLCRQFANRLNGWESPFGWNFPQFYSPTEYMMVGREYSNPEAVKFFTWFISDYYAHVLAKGLINNLYQHLADEPISANAKSYIQFAKFIKKLAPQLKVAEAVGTMEVSDYIDILIIPLGDLPRFQENISQLQLGAKKHFWLYTSIHPQGEYANRFIEFPLMKTTIIPWIVEKYHMDGYLHWGLNFWGEHPYENASVIQFADTYEFPAGDAFLVYPGDRGLNPSIRALAMRRGIKDVALLELLKSKAADRAKIIVDRLVKGYDKYELSTFFYLQQKREILELLTRKI